MFVLKYDLLGVLSEVLEMGSACGPEWDLYGAVAASAAGQEMLFGWCITSDQLPDIFAFNEKHLPAYFGLFARLHARVPDLYQRYVRAKREHAVWVTRNILFAEHLGRPHPVAREACCRFYDGVLARGPDCALFLAGFFDLAALRSKPQDVLWVLLRFFGEAAPPLPDAAYAAAALERRGLAYALSYLRPGRPEAPAALRVVAAFLAHVAPADAAQAAQAAEALFQLFAEAARRRVVGTAAAAGAAADVDEGALQAAWERLLARATAAQAGLTEAIVRALRGFLVAQQRVLRVSKRHWDELGSFAESVRRLLVGCSESEEALGVAFLVAMLCGDAVCGELVEREAERNRLPKLTRDEVQALCKSLCRRGVVGCEMLCKKIPCSLIIYGKILAENVKNIYYLSIFIYLFI